MLIPGDDIVMTSLPLAHVFRCLFTFVLVSASRWLAEIWQLSQWGATGELDVEFKFQRHSCKLLSFSCPAARAPRKACSQAKWKLRVQTTSCKRPLTLRIFGDRLGKVRLYFFMTNTDIIILQKCPFEAITIINLPSNLEKETTHRYSANSFKLHRFVLAA